MGEASLTPLPPEDIFDSGAQVCATSCPRRGAHLCAIYRKAFPLMGGGGEGDR